MLIRQLHYLVALAREEHFARAAAACNVTQPTLSAAIKGLEEILGVLIVERGHRFVGLTPEGERVLAWAQRVIADYDGLAQELGSMREGLLGQLRIGTIPVALPVVHVLTEAFALSHPRTTIRVMSMTSVEIQRGLDAFSLDAGITYLDNEGLARVRSHPLYQEGYRLIVPRDHETAERETITWREASALRLCLLTEDMQNRRIVDMHFREAGVVVGPSFETNSPLALLALLKTGNWSTVLPTSYLGMLAPELAAIPLVEPHAVHTIGLVTAERDPQQPMAAALMKLARKSLMQPYIPE